jgi:hypothetical protein
MIGNQMDDEESQPIETEADLNPNRFSLRALLIATTCFAFVMQAFIPTDNHYFAVVKIGLTFIGIVYLATHFYAWLTTHLIEMILRQSIQSRLRDDEPYSDDSDEI